MEAINNEKRRGMATYISWGHKIAAASWAVFAGTYCVLNGSMDTVAGVFIAIVTAAIAAPSVPIDISKIKQA